MRIDLSAAQHERPLAASVRVHIANKPAEVVAAKRLKLGNHTPRNLGGGAADRGGRVDSVCTVQAGHTLLEHTRDGGAKVPQLRGLQKRRFLRNSELAGNRFQLRANTGNNGRMFATVLRRSHEPPPNSLILGAAALGDARGAARQRVRFEGAAFPGIGFRTENQFRGGTHQIWMLQPAMTLRQFDAKNKRVGLLCAQVVVHPGKVEGARCVIGPQQAREHNLIQLMRFHTLNGGRHRLPIPGVFAALNLRWFGESDLVLGHRDVVDLQVLGHEQVRGGIGVKRNEANHGGASGFGGGARILKGDLAQGTGSAHHAGAGGKHKIRKIIAH